PGAVHDLLGHLGPLLVAQVTVVGRRGRCTATPAADPGARPGRPAAGPATRSGIGSLAARPPAPGVLSRRGAASPDRVPRPSLSPPTTGPHSAPKLIATRGQPPRTAP